MTGENLQPNPEQPSPIDVEKLMALAGFTIIVQHNPKSPESRSLDEWQYEAAGLRTPQDRADHIEQRFGEWLASDENLLPFYLMTVEENRKS